MGKKLIIPGVDFSTNSIQKYEFNVSSLVSCGGTIKNADSVWLDNRDYLGGIILLENFSSYDSISIKTCATESAVNGGNIAFLTETEPNWGSKAQFAGDYNSCITLTEKNTWYNFDIPNNAVALYVYLKSGDISYRPQELLFGY